MFHKDLNQSKKLQTNRKSHHQRMSSESEEISSISSTALSNEEKGQVYKKPNSGSKGNISIELLSIHSGSRSSKTKGGTQQQHEHKSELDAQQLQPQKIVDNTTQEWAIMLTLQENLNVKIGVQIYKKNLNAAFWNYISTPINFIITLFTALSAGQTASNLNILTQPQMFCILFTSFILSIINVFFKLKEKALINHDAAKKYELYGLQFDEIYYRPLNTDADVLRKIADFTRLNRELEFFASSETIDSVNYATEILFNLMKMAYFKDGFHGGKYYGEKRLNRNERIWFLDGKKIDKDYYKNNYEISMDNFLVDFSQNLANQNNAPLTHGQKRSTSFTTPRISDSSYR